MWLQNHNGGTSVAAEEVADDRNQSIRQEGLKPGAKDPVSELAKVSCSHEHMLCQLHHSCCHCSVSSGAFSCFPRKHLYMHDPQGEVESKEEGLKREEGLKPAAKDPSSELAMVSCSHAISATIFLLSLFCLLCCYFLCSQDHMHDPQEEIESGKEELKNQVGLEPAIKIPVGELAKVSCSHEHMLSQPQYSCCHCSVSCAACFGMSGRCA